jgi:O-acetylhomoserine/O-acetylserine sulfhydrylase-like pyridoxal-dependent enzyme
MISQGVTTSFKQGQYLAVHNFLTDTFMVALYSSSADLGAATTTYTTTGEITGTGYTAGGVVITGATVNVSGTGVFIGFDNVVISPAAFTCRGALIYNASKANASVAVLDFGADKTPTTSFTIQMPAATLTSALIRTP